jgi:acyl carrier protein
LGVTVLETVPTLLGMMIEQQEEKGEQRLGLKRMRWMISNAEALPVSLCQRWTALYPALPLLNAYGPTECSDDISHYVIDESLNKIRGSAPLGLPLQNTQAYVLDERMQPVPTGMLGEMYIGGIGVGRGYLNRSALTAERFLPDPFSKYAGSRLYKTGDRVRRYDDGKFEFVGRFDYQVKVRGLRIELAEIETVLNQYESIQRAVVITREDEPGDKRIVGYVVAKGGATLHSSDLRSHARKWLPEYMVPNAFVVLDEMPLTANEKIDRNALPRPERHMDDAVAQETFVAPRNPVEEKLAVIWREALEMDRVGIHDNFFELGGHSLLATRVISRVRNELKVQLHLRVLFDGPTIAELAKAVASAQNHATTGDGPKADVPDIHAFAAVPAETLMSQLKELTEEQIDQLIDKI